MKKNKTSFIKADLRSYRKTCNRDVECICLIKKGIGRRFKNDVFEWQGETEDEYFFIRYMSGIISVGIADNELEAKHKYAPMGFIDELCDCEWNGHSGPDVIGDICQFLKWKLPAEGVDDLSFN